MLGDDARALRDRGQARVRPARRRDDGARPRTPTGQRGLRRGPARGRPAATRRPSRRCSRPTPSGPSRARAFLAETGPGDAARRASRAPSSRRRCSSVRSWASRRTSRRRRSRDSLEGPLLRPVRARRRLGGGDPGAPVEQLVRVDPDDVGPRGVPGPPLAPRACARRNPSDVRKVYSTPYFSEGWALYAERVMRERGLLRGPDPRAPPPRTRRCSAPRGSSSTRRSTWAR